MTMDRHTSDQRMPQTSCQATPPQAELTEVTLQSLHKLCDISCAENGQFLCSTFSLVDDQDYFYFGQAPIERTRLRPDDLKKHLKLIPDEQVYPAASPRFQIAPTPIDEDVYIKRPLLTYYEDLEETGFVPKLLLEEAVVLQLIMQNPHPNIVRYRGCTVRRGYITGLVVDRYPMTLDIRLENGAHDFDKDKCIKDVASGVMHLHSLGLAHNDLNPNNIVVDKEDNSVIIDFGSCKPYGQQLMTAGTPEWIEEEFDTSEKKHDEFALEKLRTWLAEK